MATQVLVEHALLLVSATYGNHHVKFADCQIALGYFLLNVDQVDYPLVKT